MGLTLLPLGCVSPPFFMKEPQTEPLLGERTEFWPLCLLPLRSLLHIGYPHYSVVLLWANQDLDQLVVMRYYWWQFNNSVFSLDTIRIEVITEIPLRRNCYQYHITERRLIEDPD